MSNEASAVKRLWWRIASRWSPPQSQSWTCGPVTIFLPPHHNLPLYQRLHPRYDRFLPHLVRHLPADSAIVDVGANVGDTLAGMVSGQPQARYVCVEPDDAFHALLLENVERLRAAVPGLSVVVVKAMVGKSLVSASLAGYGGTKHAQVGPGQSTETLDDILSRLSLPEVSLLKSDVDGYDWDVIESAERVLAVDQPVVFFECHFADDAQQQGFERCMATLMRRGYGRWTVFDNFGEVMLADTSPTAIVQLMRYVRQQNLQRTSRTIHYLDILASTTRHVDCVEAALSSY